MTSIRRTSPGLIGSKSGLTLVLSPDSILSRQDGRRSCFSLSAVEAAAAADVATSVADVVTVVVAVEPKGYHNNTW